MQTITDKRRTIYIHENATVDDLPVTGTVDLVPVSDSEPFVPDHMENPKIYMGDVIAGVNDGSISFVELVVEKIDDAVITVPLDVGTPGHVPDNIFTSRMFKADEIHIYEGIGSPLTDLDVEFDSSKLDKPQRGRPR